GDHRLGQPAQPHGERRHPLLEAQAVQGGRRGPQHPGAEVLHVDARAEAATLAGEDHGPDVAVGGDRGEGLLELSHHHLVDGVEAGGPVQAEDEGARACGVEPDGLGHLAQTLSMMVAVPMPPPVHMVTRAVVASRRSSSSSAVPMSMAPVAPMGWPSAMAPPFTFTRSGSRPRSRMVFMGTAAKASLISHRSTSPVVMPALARQRSDAGPGAVS